MKDKRVLITLNHDGSTDRVYIVEEHDLYDGKLGYIIKKLAERNIRVLHRIPTATVSIDDILQKIIDDRAIDEEDEKFHDSL